MASSYPNGLDSFATNKTDVTGQAVDHPAHHNNLADAVNKIEAELGTTPSGSFATVRQRLEDIEADYQQESEKGTPNGYASLDATGKVPTAQLPSIESEPPGVVKMYAGGLIPTGYLLCDGSAISRTTYAALFDKIGTVWGAGDGSTTFNLPDMRGRVPVGVNPAGSALTNVVGNVDGRAQAARSISHRHAYTAPTGTINLGSSGGGNPVAGTVGSFTSGDANNQDYPAYGTLNFIIKT